LLFSRVWHEDCDSESGSDDHEPAHSALQDPVWAARSVALIAAVLFLGVLLRFSSKR